MGNKFNAQAMRAVATAEKQLYELKLKELEKFYERLKRNTFSQFYNDILSIIHFFCGFFDKVIPKCVLSGRGAGMTKWQGGHTRRQGQIRFQCIYVFISFYQL